MPLDEDAFVVADEAAFAIGFDEDVLAGAGALVAAEVGGINGEGGDEGAHGVATGIGAEGGTEGDVETGGESGDGDVESDTAGFEETEVGVVVDADIADAGESHRAARRVLTIATSSTALAGSTWSPVLMEVPTMAA